MVYYSVSLVIGYSNNISIARDKAYMNESDSDIVTDIITAIDTVKGNVVMGDSTTPSDHAGACKDTAIEADAI